REQHGLRRLLDFGVISCVGFHAAVGHENGTGILTGVDDDAFAKNFAWQIIPFVLYRGAAKSKKLVLGVLDVDEGLVARSLITEDAKVIANLYALGVAKVHVNQRVFTIHLRIFI